MGKTHSTAIRGSEVQTSFRTLSARASKNAVHPVLLKQWNAFPLQESRQMAAVALLLLDEQLQRRQKILIERRQARCASAPYQPRTIGALTQLKLPNRSAHESQFVLGELSRMRPWERLAVACARREEVNPARIAHIAMYFVIQSTDCRSGPNLV